MPDEQSTPNPQGPANVPETAGNAQPPKAPESPDIQRLIQASEDRVRTQYTKELKQRDQIIDELRQSTMTEAQLRKAKETQLSEREATVRRQEMELLAVNVLTENQIPLSLREFIIGKDADETKARAGTLKTEFQKAVEAAVSERFKAGGRDPAKASDPPANGKGKTYTQAEVDAEMKRVTRPETPQKERETIMAEIHAAMREGRIKR